MVTIEELVQQLVERGGSDLHISAGAPPMIRIHGRLISTEQEVLDGEATQKLVYSILDNEQILKFEKEWELDMAFGIAGLGRFRANIFYQRGAVGAVLRSVPFEIKNMQELGLPQDICEELCNRPKGLILVTGSTGSGKSTTLAAMIEYVNRTRNGHIMIIEDPIEFVHRNQRCLVNQREVGIHTSGFKAALRAALREDPDVVLVGELRDLETIAIAIETAETGHLVFGTLHTNTAPSTVDRIIDQFPADRQAQIRMMLSESLKGVIAQTLCKRIGGGRVAAHEILLCSSGVSNLIREGKTFQIPSMMQTGKAAGMATLGDSLLELVKRRVVEPREAWLKAVNKAEFRGLLERAGVAFDPDA
jgi:twitching motility protein PilT